MTAKKKTQATPPPATCSLRVFEAARKAAEAKGTVAQHEALAELREAFKELDAEQAPEAVETARGLYGTDDVEVDDLTVRADDGTWVLGWLWVADEAPEDEEDEECCEACGDRFTATGPGAPSAADPDFCTDCYIEGRGSRDDDFKEEA